MQDSVSSEQGTHPLVLVKVLLALNQLLLQLGYLVFLLPLALKDVLLGLHTSLLLCKLNFLVLDLVLQARALRQGLSEYARTFQRAHHLLFAELFDRVERLTVPSRGENIVELLFL